MVLQPVLQKALNFKDGFWKSLVGKDTEENPRDKQVRTEYVLLVINISLFYTKLSSYKSLYGLQLP